MAVHADPTDRELSSAGDDSALEDDVAQRAERPDVADGDDAADAMRRRPSALAVGAFVMVAFVISLGVLLAWLGHGASQARQAEHQRELFLQVARQGAINLTTIDHTRVEADIQRVLDSSTGAFHDDFQQRSAPFAEVVKQAKSISRGSVVDAGIESIDGDTGQVLVSVSVTTTNAAAAEQEPRHWRMRISVQQDGDQAKVSNVGFVP